MRTGGLPWKSAAFGVAASAVTACAAIVGLERRPGLVDEADGASSDASADIEAGPVRYCEAADGSYFCEDFDDPSEVPGSRWRGIAGIVPSPLVQGDASAQRVASQPASSAPSALEILAEYDTPTNTSAGLGFVHAFKPGVVASPAVELSADVRIAELDDLRDAGAQAGDAATPSPRTSIIGVFVQSGPAAEGALLSVSSRYIAIIAGTPLSQRPEEGAPVVADFDYVRASRVAWVRVTLVAGRRESVQRRAQEATGVAVECPDRSAVTAAWASVPIGTVTCIPAPDALGSLSTQLVGITAGLIVGEPARARFLLDSIRFDPVP